MKAITENTYIPIGLIASILSFIIGSTWWAASLHSRVAQAEDAVTDVKASQKELVHELKTVNETLSEIRILLAKKSK